VSWVLSTKEIMDIALRLVGFSSIPEDSTVYVEGEGIKKVLFGIDADAPELLFAKQTGHEAVISHHPKGGSAILDFHKVFSRHIQLMADAGIPHQVATEAVRVKLTALEVENHTRNYGHAVDLARLLGMPYMNIHTPLDELGRRIMTKKIQEATGTDSTVGDVVSALKKLPEFKNAATDIKIRLGNAANPAGKVVVSHGAGTNGGYEIAKTYFQYGVNTLIYIHVSPSDLERLRTDGVGNLIVTGHIASDSVGINPFLEELTRKGVSVTKLGIVPP
jgi:putative NIF3 family GTP cyclohydrolase 1 type 2